MRSLVTGISGFVGGHLAEHLLESGDLVVGLSNTGLWPENLAHLAREARIEACDLAAIGQEPDWDRTINFRGHLARRMAQELAVHP